MTPTLLQVQNLDVAFPVRSGDRTDFVSAVRALDRVLLSGDYVVPLFYTPRQWVPYWARLKHPEKTPLFGYSVDTWWVESK